MIRLKRAYEAADASDGYRVLVERLWPRGVRKEDLHLDAWLKDIAPSDALRRWFGHDPARWRAFKRRYEHELREPGGVAAAAVASLARRARTEDITLIYAARDEEHNGALVLEDELARARSSSQRRAAPARSRQHGTHRASSPG